MDYYVVCYAKITTEKSSFVSMSEVYFGGVAQTLQDAEVIARDCVNSSRGGTIVPKIAKTSEDDHGCIIDTLDDLVGKLDDMLVNMQESEIIINNSSKKRVTT